MPPRHSTRAEMVRKLTTLELRSRFHADLARGVAHGLAAAGLTSDHVEAAIDTDKGRWITDGDRRRVWERTP